MQQRIPVVYGSQDRLDMVAVRWRGQFAENGKHLAYSATLPEMNHNEIAGWEHPSFNLNQLLPIFLRDREDHPRVQIRFEITRNMLAEKAGDVLEFWTDGESWLERLWTLILLGDWASVYLAFLNEEDPTRITAIQSLKDRLKESA
jgi:glucose/mannose-6-phosphate isomerase